MINEIQKFDCDRYLSLIFAPRNRREDMMSVILFNIEIARIKSKVSEAMMGMIRLQWWREAIDEIFDESNIPRRHDIVSRIDGLVKKYPALRSSDFITIIDAREKDLESEPFKTTDEFNSYITNTSYPLNKIMLDILDARDVRIYAAVKELSYAWALSSILRSAYKNFSASRSVFPHDLMQKHGMITSDFGKPGFIERSEGLVKELCAMAYSKLEKCEEILKQIPKGEKKRAIPVLLNIRTTKHHLKQIKKNDYDIFTKNINPNLGIRDLLLIYAGRI